MKVKVLVVDDVRTIRSIVRSCLEPQTDYQFEIVEAVDGKKALALLADSEKTGLPDLIILDRVMPEMSGDECIKVIKSDERWKHIPVIFLTAQDDKEEIVKGLSELQADDYIGKPFDRKELVARVKVMLRVKLAEDKSRALNIDLQQSLSAQKKISEDIQRAYEELKITKVQLAETEAVAAMTRIFEKFVPKQYLQRIAKTGLEHIRLGSVEIEHLTIIFSDIRAFTTRSEKMKPENIFTFLNEYLSLMAGSIQNHNGFVDKFVGDAIMALFNADNERLEVKNAVNAALEMQNQLKVFNQRLISRGETPIQTGVGIHTGNVMIGTLGSEQRMDSTVIGDAVNVAARLEGLTKQYDCQIVISSTVFGYIENKMQHYWRELDYVNVKGRSEPVRIFEIFDSLPEVDREQKLKMLPPYHEGLKRYYGKQWDLAIQNFQKALTVFNDPVSKMYVQRCATLKANPPPDNWNGSFQLTSK